MIRAVFSVVLLAATVYGLYSAYMINYTQSNPFQ